MRFDLEPAARLPTPSRRDRHGDRATAPDLFIVLDELDLRACRDAAMAANISQDEHGWRAALAALFEEGIQHGTWSVDVERQRELVIATLKGNSPYIPTWLRPSWSNCAISTHRGPFMNNVIIVGGGIGGLALAQGLRRNGVEVAVYERDAHRDDRVDRCRARDQPGRQPIVARLSARPTPAGVSRHRAGLVAASASSRPTWRELVIVEDSIMYPDTP